VLCATLAAPALAAASYRQTYTFVNGWQLPAVPFQAYGMAMAPDGNLLIASHNNYVAEYTTAGALVGQPGPDLAGLKQIDNVAASGGSMWVADPSDNVVDKLTMSGDYDGVSLSSLPSSASSNPEFANVGGVAVDASGCVYVSDGGSNDAYSHRVSKFDSSGHYLCKFGDTGTDNSKWLYDTRSIAIGPHFEVYVADWQAGKVRRYTPNATRASYTLTASWANDAFPAPTSVAVDAAGAVFVLDQDQGTITKLDSSGHVLAHWGGHGITNGTFTTAWSIAVAPNGHVFVDDRDGATVQEFRLLDLGPTTSASANVTVKKGKNASFKYEAIEDVSSTVSATIKVYKGTTLKATISCGTVTQGVWHSKSWKCTLSKGSYTWKVYATDGAGNAQRNIASKTLKVTS
jgi:streptogramin lyase